ncbi:MAG: asparagine synthase-related protein [Gammaproteobacteria bacterium]|jgi:asparagine synthase (glutamine-hydrolysing)|nr:asparagine synthase-related protein [Gammaproteobacteria bacterium]
MSGIAGILAESRPDRALIAAMMRRLATRGGTDAAPWIDERAALAQTSDRAAAQICFPLRSEDGRLALVADGSLLNGAELRKSLAGYHEERDPGPEGQDWDLALTAFRLHGADFVHLLEGDFALALWDREAGTLLLARDRPGARPLCFARTPYGLAFASQARGLLPALGGAAIEPRALARFLQAGFVAGNLTLFAGVEQVAPGTAMTFDVHGTVMRGAARPTLSSQARRVGEADSTQECETLVRRIVNDTRPYGLLVDGPSSALLLALAGEEAAPRRAWIVREKNTLSAQAGQDQGKSAGWPAACEQLLVDAASLIWRLPEAAWACEEPIWDPRLPAHLALAEAAAAHDEWLLCADGAAETLGGAARYHRPRLHRWMDRMLHPESGGLPGPGAFHGQERQLFGPTLHRAAVDWREPWARAWAPRQQDSAEITRLQAIDIELRAPGRTLAIIDRAAMAHGVRTRAPWLDARMIDFGLSLPDRLKSPRGGGYLRRRLKESLSPDFAIPAPLPSVPLAAWLSGETLDRFEQVLSGTSALHYWFQPETVRELATMKRQGKQVTTRLGTLLMFALWHRIWIEGDGERPPHCDPLDFLEGGPLQAQTRGQTPPTTSGN